MPSRVNAGNSLNAAPGDISKALGNDARKKVLFPTLRNRFEVLGETQIKHASSSGLQAHDSQRFQHILFIDRLGVAGFHLVQEIFFKRDFTQMHPLAFLRPG